MSIPYQKCDRQILPPLREVAFHSVSSFLRCAEAFSLLGAHLFIFAFVAFWCHIDEIIAQTK